MRARARALSRSLAPAVSLRETAFPQRQRETTKINLTKINFSGRRTDGEVVRAAARFVVKAALRHTSAATPLAGTRTQWRKTAAEASPHPVTSIPVYRHRSVLSSLPAPDCRRLASLTLSCLYAQRHGAPWTHYDITSAPRMPCECKTPVRPRTCPDALLCTLLGSTGLWPSPAGCLPN